MPSELEQDVKKSASSADDMHMHSASDSDSNSRSAPVRRRSVVEFETKETLRAALVDCSRRGDPFPVVRRRSSSALYLGGGGGGGGGGGDGHSSGAALRVRRTSSDDDSATDNDAWLDDVYDADGAALKSGDGAAPTAAEAAAASSATLPSNFDWVTDNLAPHTSIPQTTDEEVDRLLVLRSYNLLDSDREASFERITSLASRIFSAPISLVSLVDIGRQWFMSNRGLGDVRETPRKLAFCAHAVQSTEDLLVVPDATLDQRFQNNDLVTGPPHIRFYAGAPLICPEGYRLGTLCVIDTKPRPEGTELAMTLGQKQTLRELSAMVVEEMVRRKEAKEKADRGASRLLAENASELLVPLEGARKAVRGLITDAAPGDGPMPKEELGRVASSCLDVCGKICEDKVRAYDKETKDAKANVNVNAGTSISTSGADDTDGRRIGYSTSLDGDEDKDNDNVEDGVVEMANLVESLRNVVAGDDRAKISIEVSSNVPEEIVSDNIKLFRSALNYLINAIDRTKVVSEWDVGSVKMRFYPKRNKKTGSGGRDKAYLVCECEDTGAVANPDEVDRLFSGRINAAAGSHQLRRFGLLPVADAISSLGGKYGYRTKEGWSSDRNPIGGIFWFSVPLVVPYSDEDERKRNWDAAAAKPGIIVQPQTAKEAAGTAARKATRRSSAKIISFNSGGDGIDKDEVVDAVSKAIEGKGGEVPPAAASSHQQGGPRKRALVIDDSIIVRDQIDRALTNMGFDVSTATDGMEGLLAMQACQYDVVFCDFLMPVFDGPDCIEQYRAWEETHRPGEHQRIIGLSDVASDEDIKHAQEAGMDGIVPKTSTVSDLLRKAMKIAATDVQNHPAAASEEDRQTGISPETYDLPRVSPQWGAAMQPPSGAIPLSSAIGFGYISSSGAAAADSGDIGSTLSRVSALSSNSLTHVALSRASALSSNNPSDSTEAALSSVATHQAYSHLLRRRPQSSS